MASGFVILDPQSVTKGHVTLPTPGNGNVHGPHVHEELGEDAKTLVRLGG